MTSYKLYTIWDRKAQVMAPVFSDSSDAHAIRNFAEIVTQGESNIAKYPADFDLMAIGSVDLETMAITPETHPRHIINGLTSLEDAHRQRSRYQSILSNISQEEPAPEAS